MTTALSNSASSDPELLGRFEQELLAAPDPQVVLERFQSLHPEMAETFRELAEAVQMLQETPFRPAAETASAGAESTSPARFGPYRVIRAIGRGGMGEVYEAVEEPLARRVAVKTIRRSQSTGATSMARFDRERRTLAKLHHTNIVPIFATGCEGELLYFAMPYLSGASLGQVIKTALSHGSSGSPLSNSSFEQLLQEAHSRSQSASERTTPPVAVAPQPAAPAEVQAVDAGSPGRAPSSVSAGDAGMPLLSKTYIRTAVAVMTAVAEGVHHAHEAGVVHRDLKPSNIMVETGGHAWVLDFGLASLKKATHDGVAAPVAFAIPAEPDASLTAGPIGTPPYMAPEQHRDGTQADARTDVWGLGATLYELLTLQRAFATGRSVLEDEPKSPRQLNPHLDRDLEAVVLKALRKDPAHRYATAGALADDLNRWLRHEPTSARPARPARRLALWSRRNPGWAAATLTTMLAILGAGAAGTWYYRAQARSKERELQLMAIQRLRMAQHRDGWSAEAWGLVRQAAAIGTDDALQIEAAGCLAGYDARVIQEFKDFGAASLAFDRDGRRLLIGAVTDAKRHPDPDKPLPARLWDFSTRTMTTFSAAAMGPVAFRGDGTPVQLVPGTEKDGLAVILLDLPRNKPLSRFIAPGGATFDLTKGDFTLTPDASVVAAYLQRRDKGQVLVAWDGASGRTLGSIDLDIPVRCIAVSPDGSLVAAGQEAGRIVVRSPATGRTVATLDNGRNRLNCLSFGRDVRRPEPTGPGPDAPHWLLAAGDSGGSVTVWDLNRRQIGSYCLGSTYDVYALAFSPDGATLASCGRYAAKLWDLRYGRTLLDLSANGAFSGAYQPIWSGIRARRPAVCPRGLSGVRTRRRGSLGARQRPRHPDPLRPTGPGRVVVLLTRRAPPGGALANVRGWDLGPGDRETASAPRRPDEPVRR